MSNNRSCVHNENKQYGTCTICSKIKLGIMLKNEYKHLGLTTTVWSYYNKNYQTKEKIIAGMLRRFAKSELYKGKYNLVIFYDNYDNSNDNELKRYKATEL